MHSGVAIHIYAANKSMTDRFFYTADGELLFVPQLGRLMLHTELGILDLAPGEIALIPRGIKFRVELLDAQARGYLLENYGASFRLPELGAIGANGLANCRDFLTPHAAYDDRDNGTFQVVAKFQGNLWATDFDHSPLDVVAWHGNYAPCKYDLARFNCINSVSFDHPDPSIYTVLTSPSEIPGTANVDFAIFPPRWIVAEHTFRPPWFHRNFMNEFMGLIHGRIRRQSRRLRPRRSQPAQLHERPRPRRRDLRTRQHRRTETGQTRRHPGLHVRNPLRLPPHEVRHGHRRPPARVLHLLADAEEELQTCNLIADMGTLKRKGATNRSVAPFRFDQSVR